MYLSLTDGTRFGSRRLLLLSPLIHSFTCSVVLSGAIPRAVFCGTLLAIEFFIYDYLRVLLHVSADDLVLTLDVLAGATGIAPSSAIQ